MPYSYRMTSRVLHCAQYHIQHCTPHTFEQFGALYLHNLDDKHPPWPRYEPSTSEFRVKTGTNEPLGPVLTDPLYMTFVYLAFTSLKTQLIQDVDSMLG